MYMLQAKTKGKACTYALPPATTAPEPASLLMEGSDVSTCPMLWTPPFHLGGLRHCHVPRGFGLRLTIQEGSGAAMRPLAPNPPSPLRRAPALTRVLRLQTAPASEVGSGADTCHMALYESWAIEIKEGIGATACSKARVCSRHARMLLRRL
jgi:hypothetical protein